MRTFLVFLLLLINCVDSLQYSANGIVRNKSRPTRVRVQVQSGRVHALAVAPNPIGAEVALSILGPSSLGFWKREYGVSYGYGGSIALAAWSAYKMASTSLGRMHALLHIVYGVRLSLFLLFRESTVPKFKKMKEKIEEKSPPNRLQRAPFIISCAALYWWMTFPVFVTSSLATPLKEGSTLARAVNGCLGMAGVGLAIQILGDSHKYWAKRLDDKKLVTGGLYSLLRHPNYTGELILWSFSALAGILTTQSVFGRSWKALGMIAGTLLGAGGIAFILALAATGLERRQKEEYGDTDVFKQWRKRTWKGLTLPSGPVAGSPKGPHTSNELEAEEGLC